MQYVKSFQEISKDDAKTAGGKGASLGEMTQAGIPVPPGFVVLAHAFDRFVNDADIETEIAAILDTVRIGEMHTVEHAAEKIQGLISRAKLPDDIAQEIQSAFSGLRAECVAVRSSATAEDSEGAAWAGQLDSFLNTTEETLFQNVQNCWASLFTPRAIFYRFEKGLHAQSISVAVVVQQMVQSEVSGVAFSVHPVSKNQNQLIIEAGLGLGETIVSGQITPDAYVVTKDPLEIIDKDISTQDRMLVRSKTGGNEWVSTLVIPSFAQASAGKPDSTSHRLQSDVALREVGGRSRLRPGYGGQVGIHPTVGKNGSPGLADSPEDDKTGNGQKLSNSQILELFRLIVKIENHYNFPCDIEWGLADGKFYILQSRPITTLQGV